MPLRTHEDAVLRMAKVKQKVAGCLRTTDYAQAYCRISSYLQSTAAQGYSSMAVIEVALKGRAVDMLNAANLR